MTVKTIRKTVEKIQILEKDIETLEKVRMSLATAEYASATIASGSGSKSYSRANIEDLYKTLNQLRKELAQYRRLLKTGSSDGIGYPIYKIYGGC